MADLAIGQTLGSFLLVDVVGRGGMAIVYKARQTSPERFVALKVPTPDLIGDPEFVARFRHEANIAASVDHPNVVPIYAVGEDRGYFFIAMRLIPGETLTTTIRRDGFLPLDRTWQILRQVADALDHAHRLGVIHRDLKPSNIMVEVHDRVTLTDFGIARARDETIVARTQGVIGTPHYMAPEQALGEAVDYRADLYALGVVAYEMLAGKVPFEADTPLAVLHRQIYDPTPSILAARPDLPPALDAAISRMLAKKPEERFPSASDFVAALDEASRSATAKLVVPDAPTLPIGPIDRGRDPNQADGHRVSKTGLVGVAVAAIVLIALIPTFGLRLVGGGGTPSTPAPATPTGAIAVAATATTSIRDTSPETPTPRAPSPIPSPTALPSPTGGRGNGATGEVPSPTARPTLPGGTIVFVSESPTDRSLHAIKPSGQGLRKLASGDAHNPACSPNGDTIAFESSRTGASLIYLARLAGAGSAEALTTGSGSDQLATWSPTGTSIAFARARPGSTAIFTIDLANHHEHQLTTGEGGDWRMSYSPDGSQIVFTSTRKGSNDLWLMNADGTNVHQLTSGRGDKRDPSWSPDGKWIAFRSDRDGHHWDLYRVSPTDGHIVQLTSDAADKGSPNWSPDGRWILFSAKRGGGPEVYVISVDGGDWIQITSPPTLGGGATWCH